MPRIRTGPPAAGIERLEAYFPGPAFAPHRHDTYGIGLTPTGVQTFGYLGTRRYGLPGQCHILHPDEIHDGAAGSEAGFGYRIVYLDPALLQEGRVAALPPGLAPALWEDLADPMDEIAQMHRLDHVRRLLAQGTPPAEASVEAGFADQSHMTRRFKRAYGLTPARWAAATTAAAAR